MKRTDTPMMRQYLALKARVPEALLLYRLGDFYELFLEDAEIAAPLLDLVLTTRDKGVADPVPMCGIPFHALEGYVRRLLEAGKSVAIAEQVESAAATKGLVRREIVEVVSPGLVANADRLAGADANYIAAVHTRDGRYGLAYLDVSTGHFAAVETPERALFAAELDRVAPREICARDAEKELIPGVDGRKLPDADFEPAAAQARVGRLPTGLAADERGPGACAAAALLIRVAELQPHALEQLVRLRRYTLAEHMVIDASTRRHLELVRNATDGGLRGTLLELLDQTRTPMGRRRLVECIGEPRVDPGAIRERQAALEPWLEPDSRRRALAQALRGVGDLERLLTRACLPGSGPRELSELGRSLAGVARVHEIAPLGNALDSLRAELERVLVADPPSPPRGEPYTGFVRDGVAGEVDRIRESSREAEEFLERFETEERERTGIPTLKLKYNRVFGYAIEIGRARLAEVPEEYRRRQTTANAERFTTDALERVEGVLRRARDEAALAEAVVLDALRERVRLDLEDARGLAREIAELDLVQSLAEVARREGWVRPEVDAGLEIRIEQGRHPVVERFAPDGFVANDVTLEPDARFIVLTGPNMAGKSTLLRQVGILVLLAQIGSYVPADSARLGVVDRIFTRVGASDSLTTGESTFMVEMREAATILDEATPRSLVLLDEIGRGTSTFDGLSIAWAVAERLHDHPGLRTRTLFATHYHELADLARTKPGVRNFHFACAERDGEIHFLRRMESGAASRSYGIEVARRAGLPPGVIRRAREVLANLEGGELDVQGRPLLARAGDPAAPRQLTLFAGGPDPLREALESLDPDGLTPLEALVELARLKGLAEEV